MQAESRFANAVREAGFAVDELPRSRLDGPLTEQDLERTVASARADGAVLAVVDHYSASSEYLGGLGDAGLAVAVIDDMADRDLSRADWLLNQNLGATSLQYRIRPECLTALGPSYALLRPEFASIRARLTRTFSVEDRRLLITFGAGDSSGPCEVALRSLEHVARRLEVRCVLGAATVRADLQHAVGRSRHAVRLLVDVRDMAQQMAWAHLSLSAAGSTCLELMCLGLPTIATALSPDQRANARALEAEGVGREISREDLTAAGRIVETLLADPARRREMSKRGRGLVDGNGAVRAAASLLSIVGTSEIADAAR